MKVKHVFENGKKFDFSQFKVGDTVVVTGTNYGWNNNKEMWPNRNKFQLNQVIEVGEDYVMIYGGYKFKQAMDTPYYFPLNNGETAKDIYYINEYLKITRTVKEIKPVDGISYDYEYKNFYENSEGCYNPRYLFPYTKEWEEKIEKCKKGHFQKIEDKKQRELKKQHEIEIRKESKEQYDAVIDPLIKKLEELQQKIYNEKCKAFDKFYCGKCKNNDDICRYENYWNYNRCNMNTKTHMDKEGFRTRPIDECNFFEKEEGK